MITEKEETKTREQVFFDVLSESVDEYTGEYIEEAVKEAASFAGVYPPRYMLWSGKRVRKS